jgi:hypothetical protein
VGIIFFSSNLFTPSWVFGEFGCKFSLSIDVLCTVVSGDFNCIYHPVAFIELNKEYFVI